jgi:DNA-binding GntR family transcriptional regulator
VEDPRAWMKVKTELLKQLESGVLEPDDEVWVQYAAEECGVERQSARKAVSALVSEGKLLRVGFPARYFVPRPDGTAGE